MNSPRADDNEPNFDDDQHYDEVHVNYANFDQTDVNADLNEIENQQTYKLISDIQKITN